MAREWKLAHFGAWHPCFLIATFLFFLSVALLTLPQNCLFPLPGRPPTTTGRPLIDAIMTYTLGHKFSSTMLSSLKLLAAIKANYSEIIVLSRFLGGSFGEPLLLIYFFCFYILYIAIRGVGFLSAYRLWAALGV